MTGFSGPIWEGVYGSFEEASGDTGVFEGQIWLDKLSERANETLKELRSPATVSPLAVSADYILPVIAALIREDQDTLRILDFGGGMAASYFPLIKSLPDGGNIEYHIVENKELCSRAGEVLPEDPHLIFHSELPDLDQPVDIVHAGSALHYVRDWREMIKRLALYQPRYLLFAEVPASDINESFVTLQNFYGRKIPVWFWNVGEFLDVVGGMGFRLIFKTRFESQLASPSLQNFDEGDRLESCCQFMFVQKKKTME